MQVLQPLIERIETAIMGSDLLHADDTPIRVLDHSLRDKGLGKGVKKGRIWTYVRDQRAWTGAAPPGAVCLFLGDGRVAMDNNAAERALRPIGVVRRNWLFAGADTGAETLARAMTIIETAKMNGLDPQAYLADVLDRIHDHKLNRLDELLRWNWSPVAITCAEAA